jgi:hypothetical protein
MRRGGGSEVEEGEGGMGMWGVRRLMRSMTGRVRSWA